MKKINLALILLFACIILLSSVFGARRHRSYHRDTFDTEHDGQDYFTDSSKDYSEKECKVGFSLRGKERNINHRIAGGRDAKEGEFPSFISLAVGYSPYDTYQFCSGVALTKTFILTAGHCFDGLGASETIWAAPGIYPPSEWRNHRELKIYRVVQRCPSPKLYENPEGAIFYDYQIMRVSEPMNNVKFARLNARADLPMGFKAVVVGVGYTEIIFGESFTHETYTKKLQVLPVELAKCAYDLPDHESHICFQSYKTTMVGVSTNLSRIPQ